MNSNIFYCAILVAGIYAATAYPHGGYWGGNDDRNNGGHLGFGFGFGRPNHPLRPFLPPFFRPRPPFQHWTRPTSTTMTTTADPTTPEVSSETEPSTTSAPVDETTTIASPQEVVETNVSP